MPGPLSLSLSLSFPDIEKKKDFVWPCNWPILLASISSFAWVLLDPTIDGPCHAPLVQIRPSPLDPINGHKSNRFGSSLAPHPLPHFFRTIVLHPLFILL